MGLFRNYKIFSFIALIIAVLWCFSPVLADNGGVSITYRGSGGAYIGDTLIFDGTNSVSNTTLLKVTGPGLPADGVPVYNLNGPAGAGNPVEVNPDGSWQFDWYTADIQGAGLMQTARYYITAFDQSNPSETATTSVMLKAREFYVVPTPNPIVEGGYMQLLGTADEGAPDIHIIIQDMSGNVLHVYDTSATSTGYFDSAFHIDMSPGDYPVTISSATMGSSYQTVIHVIPPQTPVPTTGAVEAGQPGNTTAPASAVTPVLPAASASPGANVTPAPPATGNTGPATLSLPAILAGLIIAALVVLLILYLGKKI